MKSTVKKLADSKVRLEVVLEKEELFNFSKEAEKVLANNLRLEGFRPGKVPGNIARDKLGEQKIKEEALSLALRGSFSEAVKKEHLDVINQADFKIEENSPEKLVYSMTLSIFPEVNLGSYTGLAVKKNPVSVNEIEVEDAVNELARIRTAAHLVERPARHGDKVEVDFNIRSDGKEIDNGKSENHPLVIGDKKFIPGFEDQIVGLTAGDKKTFSLKVPADYYQKEIAGKDIEIDLTLKKVEELEKPKIDDEFAKGLGHFNSLADLKGHLKRNLVFEKENKEKEHVRLTILRKVADASKFDVPSTLVEEKLDGMIKDFDNELHGRGMELGLYLAHLKKTQDDLRRDWRTKAKEQVGAALVMRAIARKENLKVDEEEVDKEFAVLAEQYTRQGLLDELKKSDPAIVRSRIKDILMNEKVFDFLEKSNVVS